MIPPLQHLPRNPTVDTQLSRLRTFLKDSSEVLGAPIDKDSPKTLLLTMGGNVLVVNAFLQNMMELTAMAEWHIFILGLRGRKISQL